MDTTILLVRHAESIKNINDIHGGTGDELTRLGLAQAEKLVETLRKIGVKEDNAVITYAPSIQTIRTAEAIIKSLNIQSCVLMDFKPLYLGVAHGLSNEEVKKRYPAVYNTLTRWRKKEIEICDLEIPDMENHIEFYNRGLKFLNNIVACKYNIFVVTNSLYILLLNIMLGNTPQKGGGYKHFDIQNCGITLFCQKDGGRYALNCHCTDVEDVLVLNR